MTANLPPRVTADTGIDVLHPRHRGPHAVPGTTTSPTAWPEGHPTGVRHLPIPVSQGAKDMEARERMHNAATIAGMAFGNAQAALAHSLGHTLGASFHIPHGRSVGMYLPYTIEYCVRGPGTPGYADLARFLGLPATDGGAGRAANLAAAIRDLERRLGLPSPKRDGNRTPRSTTTKSAAWCCWSKTTPR
ncbi:iron-containing alcohol dehydrogenase [Candidatus Amarolinea dominans]|uniref:iron-containing alcohol dehydrogenase n=1 Tax=Candidatus Amarolinea dominans TaxID=3140696 RepID=UPI001E18F3F2|nr:iron-containing alcohol dehydrogenase [Anaerolineae bacterium]